MAISGAKRALTTKIPMETLISTPSPLIKLAKDIAGKHKLDPILVCALIEQESTWNPYAIRYEPAFMRKYVAPLYTADKISATEAYARCFSWGLGQTMGQVAREHGYKGPFPQICEPEIGIELTCNVLLSKLKLSDGDVQQGLQHYNGGGDPLYASKVLARMPHYGGTTPAIVIPTVLQPDETRSGHLAST